MLQKSFKHFMDSHFQSDEPLLLGLSGGPDSMALFHLLAEGGYPFAAAHLDHGWREESAEEALLLKSLCEKWRIPFYLKRASFAEKKNLEDQGRRARLEFYKELGFKTLVLGHHADDKAETILKRLFEGASLHALGGLESITIIADLRILRPLLGFRKADLLEYLESKGVSYFVDRTNLDPQFLRGRMRSEILPHLSAHFGKEVQPSLLRIGESGRELAEHVEHMIKPYMESIVLQDGMQTIDLSNPSPQTTFEWKMVVKEFLRRQGVTPTMPTLEKLVFHLREKPAKKTMLVGGGMVTVHRCTLSIRLNSEHL